MHKYPAIAKAVAALGAQQAYLDGELCGLDPDGVTSFSMIQLGSDAGNAAGLVFFLFDLLRLDGDDLAGRSSSARDGSPSCFPVCHCPSNIATTKSGTGPPFTPRPAR
jgi:hypothetical protein